MDYTIIGLAVGLLANTASIFILLKMLKRLEAKVDKLDMETDQIAGIIFDNHVQINELKAKKEDIH